MSKAPQQESKVAPPIRLINRTRRPVCFRADGKTVRLGPGERSAELTAHCAGTTGVRSLCEKGILALLTPSVAERTEKEERAAAEEGAQEDAEAERSVTDQPGSNPSS